MRVSVICVSDRCFRGEREDKSGEAIFECLAPIAERGEYVVVPDEIPEIENAIMSFADEVKSELIITTGGTGFAPRDVTPEATERVIEKRVPGIPEAIRARSLEITDRAMLSRATAGIRGRSLIINLPGSPKAVRESIGFIIDALPHAVEVLSGDTLSCGGNYGENPPCGFS